MLFPSAVRIHGLPVQLLHSYTCIPCLYPEFTSLHCVQRQADDPGCFHLLYACMAALWGCCTPMLAHTLAMLEHTLPHLEIASLHCVQRQADDTGRADQCAGSPVRQCAVLCHHQRPGGPACHQCREGSFVP